MIVAGPSAVLWWRGASTSDAPKARLLASERRESAPRTAADRQGPSDAAARRLATRSTRRAMRCERIMNCR